MLLPEGEAPEERIAVHCLGVEFAEEMDGFANFDFFRQVGGLQAHADAIFELFTLRAGVESQNGDVASTAGTQAFKNLDSGGFTGAVRTEKSEHLAGVHFKIDAFDGREVTVVFCEGCDLNDWILNGWPLLPSAKSLACGDELSPRTSGLRELGRATAAVPEMKDFNKPPVFVNPVVDVVGRVVKFPELPAPRNNRTDIGERLEDSNVVDQRLAQPRAASG